MIVYVVIHIITGVVCTVAFMGLLYVAKKKYDKYIQHKKLSEVDKEIENELKNNQRKRHDY